MVLLNDEGQFVPARSLFRWHGFARALRIPFGPVDLQSVAHDLRDLVRHRVGLGLRTGSGLRRRGGSSDRLGEGFEKIPEVVHAVEDLLETHLLDRGRIIELVPAAGSGDHGGEASAQRIRGDRGLGR